MNNNSTPNPPQSQQSQHTTSSSTTSPRSPEPSVAGRFRGGMTKERKLSLDLQPSPTSSHHSHSHHSSLPLASRYHSIGEGGGSTTPDSNGGGGGRGFNLRTLPGHISPYGYSNSSKVRDHHHNVEECQSLLPPYKNHSMRSQSSQSQSQSQTSQERKNGSNGKKKSDGKSNFLYYFIYALLNTIMSVPSLYGYASVIFNHECFQPHMATLSKLVIWSSAVHQSVFVSCSSLSFAKAEVQDAGLLFLSCMSRFIAQTIIDEGGSVQEVLSTTIVTLSVATASLGLVLMFLGKFNCANAVSYLPLPVVGGYLAFIGYFCVIAGIGLCISESIISQTFMEDIQLLTEKQSLMLAVPGLISGLVMMLVARFSDNDAALPTTMIAIPAAFYMFLFFSGNTMEDARHGKWVGEIQPTASIDTLLDLVDFHSIRWDLVISSRCISVWVGMVFVVSFSSCLDVAAISMDMGEALDLNNELITVGLSNLISGLSFGQTGSYIFSQTILIYRTGYLSRWVGVMGSMMFLAVVISKVNFLEIAPLFFLGSTLIFIGFDLLYEWIFEVYHKLIPSEYIVLITTFVAIQIVGIDGGIIFGIIVAVVEYVVSTSQLTSLRRVVKHSRNVWQPQHRTHLQEVGYGRNPKIVTLEITETVFFGSSLHLLSRISDEIGISASATDMMEMGFASPHHRSSSATSTPRPLVSTIKKNRQLGEHNNLGSSLKEIRTRPRFVVLDLSQVPNVDATAARSCFLQLARMCSKNGIILCAATPNARVSWVLLSHDVAYSSEEEEIVKNDLLYSHHSPGQHEAPPSGKILLFDSIDEALQLCEHKLINDLERRAESSHATLPAIIHNSAMESGHSVKTSLSTIFGRMLGTTGGNDDEVLEAFEEGGRAGIREVALFPGDSLFSIGEISDCFYVVLAGSIEIYKGNQEDNVQSLTSSGRSLSCKSLSSMIEKVSIAQPTGSIFGYVDFALDRRRSFDAKCSRDGTIVAKICKESMEQDTHLSRVLDKVLLQASLMELRNFDVS